MFQIKKFDDGYSVNKPKYAEHFLEYQGILSPFGQVIWRQTGYLAPTGWLSGPL